MHSLLIDKLVRILRRFATIVALLVAVPQAGIGYYSSYTFDTKDSTRTSVDDLIYDRYPKQKVETYTGELKKLQAQYESRKTDPNFLDEAAFIAFKCGRAADAEKIWKDLLSKEPDRFKTLANYGCALQEMGRLDEAHALIVKAAAAKPGFRSGVETLHARMIDFKLKNQKDASYGASHLFVDELTPVWKGHTEPGSGFPKADVSVVSTQGVAELLHQYPTFADGWLVLAILLEQDQQYSQSLQAYRKAMKHGSAQNEFLKTYIEKFIALEGSRSKLGAAGRGMLQLTGAALLIFFGSRLLRLLKGMYEDRIEARRRTLEDQYRDRRGGRHS